MKMIDLRILFEGMQTIWNIIQEMAWQATFVILLIIVCRLFIKKYSTRACYLLWLVVAVRLFFPVLFPSSVSIFNWIQADAVNRTEMVEKEIQEVPLFHEENNYDNQLPDANISHSDSMMESNFVNKEESLPSNISDYVSVDALITESRSISSNFASYGLPIIWIVGMVIMLGYGIVTYGLLKHKLRFATKNPNGFMECDQIASPFVFGIMKPIIYMPYHLNEQEQDYILLHERYHIKRRDYLIKILAFLLLAIYWFHPLVWIAFYLMSQDMEMSCDEEVLKELGIEERKAYSTLLLSFAGNRRYPLPAPLSFGENNVKSRIKQILNYKKPTFWGIVAVIAVSILVTVSCLTDAKKELPESNTEIAEENLLAFSETLYEAKNPYIGDISADGKLLSLLWKQYGIKNSAGTELQTYEEPYWITISFTEKPDDTAMWKAASVFLALVGNCEEFRWEFTENDMLYTYYVNATDLQEILKIENIKDFGTSSEKVAELLMLLEEHETRVTKGIDQGWRGEINKNLNYSFLQDCAQKTVISWDVLNQYEQKLLKEKIPYRGDDVIVADCYYEDFDQSGIMDFIVITKEGENGDARFILFMNNDSVYVKAFTEYFYDTNIISGDIDHDGNTELIYSCYTGGLGGSGSYHKGILKYENHSLTPMELPGDFAGLEKEWGDAGFYINVWFGKGENEYEVVCPALGKTDIIKKDYYRDADGNYLVQPYPGGEAGANCRGFYNLQVIKENGRDYLMADEYFYGEAGANYGLGFVRFIFDWDETEGWIVKDYEVHTFEEENKKDDIATETAKKWAQAFYNGDGQTIISMASGEVIEQFQKEGVLERFGDNVRFSLGSSPMFIPWSDDIIPYIIVSQDDINHTVDILYYTWTSDPHIYVWREQLTFTPTNDEYIVSKESIVCYDNITTLEDFLLAYPMGIRETPMNYYEVNSLGEQLEKNALLSSNNLYKDLFDPALAAYHLLNIGNKGKMPTEVETSGDVDSRSIKITFPDGSIEISVCRPYSENGIWIPYDYVVYKD